ncbi:MAG TPA: amidohydrolase family protein [Anaerolineae bacterium]|nr:amidohydrolase family protein [Anaerolineae bacterium]HPL29381.1 amidohydrolase family protein [Anaerolineae bacterium]
MIVDAHAHIGKWYYPTAQLTVPDMLAYMTRYGIDVSILSSTLAIVYDAREGNQELAQAIEGCPQLLGYVSVNLNYLEESLEELDRYLGSGAKQGGAARFVGVKVHPLLARHRYDTPEGMALTRAVAAYGVPILVHTFGSALESPWNVLPAARANPEVPIILGHMGGDCWWEGIRVARESPNLYLEVCSTWTDPEKVRLAVAAVGAERVLFGSDATLFDAAYALGAMEDAGLSAEERALIMGGNARRLFGIKRS